MAGACADRCEPTRKSPNPPAFHTPKVIGYGADPLSEPVRRLISERFGAHVVARYGAVEAFRIAFECERHTGMHLNADLYPLRIVDAEGRELPEGERGQVAISNLVNRGTVLLSYRLGDLANRLPGSCPCGRSLPLLSLSRGTARRLDRDGIRTARPPRGARKALRRRGSGWSYQPVQPDRSRFGAAVIVASDGDGESVRARLRRELAGVLGPDADIDVRVVDSLPRTGGGKVMRVVALPEGRPNEEGSRQHPPPLAQDP